MKPSLCGFGRTTGCGHFRFEQRNRNAHRVTAYLVKPYGSTVVRARATPDPHGTAVRYFTKVVASLCPLTRTRTAVVRFDRIDLHPLPGITISVCSPLAEIAAPAA
eukprot:6597869-Prymnesium_polylepis.1